MSGGFLESIKDHHITAKLILSGAQFDWWCPNDCGLKSGFSPRSTP